MKRFIPTSITQNRLVRSLAAVMATIFLGAIGSGLWAGVLSPFVDVLTRTSLSLISSVFHGYLDHVYGSVSHNPAAQLAALPLILIVVVVIFISWAAPLAITSRLKRIQKEIESPNAENEETPTKGVLLEEVKKLRRSAARVWVPAALIITVMYSEELFVTFHGIRAALFIERSIEIIAPHVDEQERLKLRARFRSVEGASDFYELEDRLRAIAREHSAKLPDFESVR